MKLSIKKYFEAVAVAGQKSQIYKPLVYEMKINIAINDIEKLTEILNYSRSYLRVVLSFLFFPRLKYYVNYFLIH